MFGDSLYLVAVRVEDLVEGRPNGSVLRRVFRQGVREGRRGINPIPTREVFEETAGLAFTKITKDFEEELGALREEIARLRVVAARVAPAPPSSALPSPGTDSTEILQSSGPEHALATLRSREAVVAELRRHQEDRQEAERIRSAGEKIAQLEARIKNLPNTYTMVLETIREAAEQLWAEYRRGYEKGQQKREPETPVDLEPLSLQVPVLASSADGEDGSPSGVAESFHAVDEGGER